MYSGEDDMEEDLEIEFSEGFLLDRDVEDSILPDLTEEYGTLLQKVRAVVKFFRSSPKRNDFLLDQLRKSLGHEITLCLDVKTRWNSIITMLESFC